MFQSKPPVKIPEDGWVILPQTANRSCSVKVSCSPEETAFYSGRKIRHWGLQGTVFCCLEVDGVFVSCHKEVAIYVYD